jgi:hypothetical protein
MECDDPGLWSLWNEALYCMGFMPPSHGLAPAIGIA